MQTASFSPQLSLFKEGVPVVPLQNGVREPLKGWAVFVNGQETEDEYWADDRPLHWPSKYKLFY